MGNAQIESVQQHGAAVGERIHAAEVMPQSQRNGRQLEAALAAAIVAHRFVMFGGSIVSHE